MSGIAQVGERGAVVQVDERVDDRLPVHHDVDPLVGDAEEVMRLDHLEALVHQRGRVDRDPAAHLPGGMGERLLRGDPGEVGAAAEGPAGRGQDQPLNRARPLRADQLVERRVLGVHRDDLGVRGLGERRDQLAADHQALLVGEREVDALRQRDDRRAEAGGADHGVQHQVGFRLDDQLADALFARQDLASPLRGGPAPPHRDRRVLRRERRADAPARAGAPSWSPPRGRPPAGRRLPR